MRSASVAVKAPAYAPSDPAEALRFGIGVAELPPPISSQALRGGNLLSGAGGASIFFGPPSTSSAQAVNSYIDASWPTQINWGTVLTLGVLGLGAARARQYGRQKRHAVRVGRRKQRMAQVQAVHTVSKTTNHSATEKSTETSKAIMDEAKTLMPGGVSSPVRAFASVGGSPIVLDSAKGAKIYDVDGNEYTDYVLSWGPAILGHADDAILSKLQKQAAKGTSFGAPCALENELAKRVIDIVPSIESVRFTNSGTEACMGMLRTARAFTNRPYVVKFSGCYHGHADPFLVDAGSGVATLGLPNSPGVPKEATSGTLVAKYNDLESVKGLLKDQKYAGKVACIVLEPVVGNSGFILPSAEFLTGLRKLCDETGTLLVFDEVMTGAHFV